MSLKFSLPSRRALAIEYLIWSFGLAAFLGTAATMTVLTDDPKGLYDPQREVVHALLSWFLLIFLLAAMPLTLMALRRFIGSRMRQGYSKLRCFLRGRAPQGESTGGRSPEEISTDMVKEGAGRRPAARLLLEYVVVTTLVAPVFGVCAMIALGGFDFIIPFVFLFIEVLYLVPMSLLAVIGHIIGPVSTYLFFWSIPIIVAACSVLCIAMRLLLKLSLARVVPRTCSRSGAPTH